MSKYKININRPEVTPEEIAQHQDFNVVLHKYKGSRRRFLKNNWVIIYIVIIVIFLCALVGVKIIKDVLKKKDKTGDAVELQDIKK